MAWSSSYSSLWSGGVCFTQSSSGCSSSCSGGKINSIYHITWVRVFYDGGGARGRKHLMYQWNELLRAINKIVAASRDWQQLDRSLQVNLQSGEE